MTDNFRIKQKRSRRVRLLCVQSVCMVLVAASELHAQTSAEPITTRSGIYTDAQAERGLLSGVLILHVIRVSRSWVAVVRHSRIGCNDILICRHAAELLRINGGLCVGRIRRIS